MSKSFLKSAKNFLTINKSYLKKSVIIIILNTQIFIPTTLFTFIYYYKNSKNKYLKLTEDNKNNYMSNKDPLLRSKAKMKLKDK
jgi:hypothetical protein